MLLHSVFTPLITENLGTYYRVVSFFIDIQGNSFKLANRGKSEYIRDTEKLS